MKIFKWLKQKFFQEAKEKITDKALYWIQKQLEREIDKELDWIKKKGEEYVKRGEFSNIIELEKRILKRAVAKLIKRLDERI